MAEGHGWRVGDRVSLCPNGRESDRVAATVIAVDEPGLPRGVRVRLDHVVRGVDNAYASHNELTLLKRPVSVTAGGSAMSQNVRAEALVGRRPEGVIAFDQPCELGFWCPTCRVPALSDDGEHFDERLYWSEYDGFLWCEVCNFDYPSALCVPLHAAKDPTRPHVWAGPADAVEVYLSTLERVLYRVANDAARQATRHLRRHPRPLVAKSRAS